MPEKCLIDQDQHSNNNHDLLLPLAIKLIEIALLIVQSPILLLYCSYYLYYFFTTYN
jgi:hypothetical protein